MNKIYGYKDEEVIGLIDYIKNAGKRPLSVIFEEYAEKLGKAKGTIRNMYYALAKSSKTDNTLCDEKLSGKPITVNQTEYFDSEKERELVKKILLLKKEGYSIRNAVNLMANGDIKLALRYQNKYRNTVKNKKNTVNDIIEEIESETGEKYYCYQKEEKAIKNDALYNKLKNEIDLLVDKISTSVKKENLLLKSKIAVLEAENLRLNKIIYGEKGALNALINYKGNMNNGMIN